MGSTGEVSMLSLEEKQKIISETVKCKKVDMLLYYGCTRTNTHGTIDMVRYAGFYGPFPL
jgi:4-hydroxy-tetrahydrodipicolinate synthase